MYLCTTDLLCRSAETNTTLSINYNPILKNGQSDSTTKLQSSRQYGTGTKTEI